MSNRIQLLAAFKALTDLEVRTFVHAQLTNKSDRIGFDAASAGMRGQGLATFAADLLAIEESTQGQVMGGEPSTVLVASTLTRPTARIGAEELAGQLGKLRSFGLIHVDAIVADSGEFAATTRPAMANIPKEALRSVQPNDPYSVNRFELPRVFKLELPKDLIRKVEQAKSPSGEYGIVRDKVVRCNVQQECLIGCTHSDQCSVKRSK
jgi:hypothetical protein